MNENKSWNFEPDEYEIDYFPLDDVDRMEREEQLNYFEKVVQSDPVKVTILNTVLQRMADVYNREPDWCLLEVYCLDIIEEFSEENIKIEDLFKKTIIWKVRMEYLNNSIVCN